MPWQAIIGLRNRLARAYFSVSLEVVWEVVTTELDGLEDQINTIAAQMPD